MNDKYEYSKIDPNAFSEVDASILVDRILHVEPLLDEMRDLLKKDPCHVGRCTAEEAKTFQRQTDELFWYQKELDAVYDELRDNIVARNNTLDKDYPGNDDSEFEPRLDDFDDEAFAHLPYSVEDDLSSADPYMSCSYKKISTGQHPRINNIPRTKAMPEQTKAAEEFSEKVARERIAPEGKTVEIFGKTPESRRQQYIEFAADDEHSHFIHDAVDDGKKLTVTYSDRDKVMDKPDIDEGLESSYLKRLHNSRAGFQSYLIKGGTPEIRHNICKKLREDNPLSFGIYEDKNELVVIFSPNSDDFDDMSFGKAKKMATCKNNVVDLSPGIQYKSTESESIHPSSARSAVHYKGASLYTTCSYTSEGVHSGIQNKNKENVSSTVSESASLPTKTKPSFWQKAAGSTMTLAPKKGFSATVEHLQMQAEPKDTTKSTLEHEKDGNELSYANQRLAWSTYKHVEWNAVDGVAIAVDCAKANELDVIGESVVYPSHSINDLVVEHERILQQHGISQNRSDFRVSTCEQSLYGTKSFHEHMQQAVNPTQNSTRFFDKVAMGSSKEPWLTVRSMGYTGGSAGYELNNLANNVGGNTRVAGMYRNATFK